MASIATTTMTWQPAPQRIVRDPLLRQQIEDDGHVVMGNIGPATLASLRALYQRLHGFKATDGGMFYSLYSKDIGYRQQVHDEIGQQMKPIYDALFDAYRPVIHSFIAKLPGSQSGFTLHQDSTGLDETLHSPLSLWIPLQDTDMDNGTLCIVPKTHRFFHPLRGISFDAPFVPYQDVMRRYLLPLKLGAGDILAFDNRLVHYSHTNVSDAPRVVVMSGLFPSEAEIEVCWKDSGPQSAIEVFRQSEDFLVTNTAFYENCTDRPYRGRKVREVAAPQPARSVYDFLSWAHREGLQRTDIPLLTEAGSVMHIVSEPAGS